jgi:hypothetical protein
MLLYKQMLFKIMDNIFKVKYKQNLKEIYTKVVLNIYLLNKRF